MQISVKRLKKMAKYSKRDWIEKPQKERKCVFLAGDNNCLVYDIRPTACRSHFSGTDPDLCKIEKGRDKKYGVVYLNKTEMFASSALTADKVRNNSSMAEMLVKELKL
jgi:Fe-S-cluster containining protein